MEGFRRNLVNSITIDVMPVCDDESEYLKWQNPLGQYDYWLFNKNKIISDAISNERLFERYIDQNIEFNPTRDEVIGKDVQEEIVLGYTGLTRQQAEGMRYILRSNKVTRYMGVNHQTGLPVFQTVRIKTGTFVIMEVSETLFNIQFVMLPPKPFIQEQ